MTAEAFKGSPLETEYKKLSPTPNEFPNFVKHLLAAAAKPDDLGADKLKATKAPMFFIHGDADGVRLDHIAEMFRLKGGEVFGDMRPRSESRLAILPQTTHVTLMQRMDVIVPMVNDFLDAEPQKTQRGSRTTCNQSAVKRAGAPRPAPCRGRRPCAPTPAPRPCRRLPAPRNRPRAPWFSCAAHR